MDRIQPLLWKCVKFNSRARSRHKRWAFTTLIPDTTAEQQEQILLIERPKPPLLDTTQMDRNHLICLESKGNWHRRLTLFASEMQL